MSLAQLPDDVLRRILALQPKGLLPLYAEVCRRWRDHIAAMLDAEGWPDSDVVVKTYFRSPVLHCLALERCLPAGDASGRAAAWFNTVHVEMRFEGLAAGNVSLDDAVRMRHREQRQCGVPETSRERYVSSIRRAIGHYVFDRDTDLRWLKRLCNGDASCVHMPYPRWRGMQWRSYLEVIAVFDGLEVPDTAVQQSHILADDPRVVTDAVVADIRFLYDACLAKAGRVLRALLARRTAPLQPDQVQGMFNTVLVGYDYDLPAQGVRDVMVFLLERGYRPQATRVVQKVWLFASWKGLWLWLDALVGEAVDQSHRVGMAVTGLIRSNRMPSQADLERYSAMGGRLGGHDRARLVSSADACDSGVAAWVLEHPAIADYSRISLQHGLQAVTYDSERCFPARVRAMRQRARDMADA